MEQISIPGLRRVAAISFEALPQDIRRMRISGMTAHVAAVPLMMDIFGDSLIEWSIDAEQKRSCSLSFSSLRTLPNGFNAFIAEDRMGHRWLIGAAEPPFPKITANASSGKDSSDKRAIDYKIEWEGTPIVCNFLFPNEPAMQLI